jgi:septal ring factor EnvC (AmiA/AmiB activator)
LIRKSQHLLAGIASLALLAAAGSASAAPATPGRAEREKAHLESLRDQRSTLEKQLKENESARDQAADQLRDTDKAISTIGRRLRALGDERSAAQAELSGHERNLKQLERQTANRQEQLARLLRHQFRPQEADALAVLLAGGDPNAAARDRHFLALLSQAKAELIAGLRRDAVETRRVAADVKARGEQLAEIAQREEKERASLRQRQQERQAVMTKISAQIKAQKREIETLKQNEQRLGKLIESLARRPAKTAPPKAQAQSGKSGKGDSGRDGGREAPANTVTSADLGGATGAFARLRGKLIRPARGSITGHFGGRRDDGQSTWKGLFFSAGEGSDVKAVAAGTVVFADWLRGYGNLLIIDHDDDFLSVYGNNQSLLADVGKKVGAGETVATVGSSIGAGGGRPDSGLYFELRYRGRVFDPLKWLGSP